MSCSVKSVLTQNLRKAVSVNGVVVRHDEISREAQNHPAATPIAAWTAAARALAVRELLLQEARRIVIYAEPLTDDEGRTETAEEAAMQLPEIVSAEEWEKSNEELIDREKKAKEVEEMNKPRETATAGK